MQHRNGGKITAITHIGHETYKGVANWFFVGDVKWSDGSESKAHQIHPGALCYENEADRKGVLEPLLVKMNAYLGTAGDWHEQKSKRDGRVYSWTPKQPNGRVEIS